MHKKYVAMVYVFIVMSVCFGHDNYDQTRTHLQQANDLFWQANAKEMGVWSQWVRSLVRKNKSSAKAWLKEKVDHC